MNGTVINFILRISFFTGAAFGLHVLVLDFLSLPLFGDQIIQSYVLNLWLAIAVFMLLYRLREKFKNKIGFLFILAGFFKFALFYVLLLKSYKADGDVSRPEFFAFFIPYSLTLVIEIFSLSLWLKKMDEVSS